MRYTVANSTSLRNVAFHWLTSEYMQLASGFMQLAATTYRRKKELRGRGNVNSALEWG